MDLGYRGFLPVRMPQHPPINLPEHIGILAVVVAELELGKLERQILLADVVVRPDDPPA
jgi:hypothetical protein